MTQPEALRLADALAAWEYTRTGLCGQAATELRRLHAENAMLHQRHHDDNVEYMRVLAQRAALLEALKEIAADYADRFDLDCPSTNPGIKSTIKQARAAIKAAEENT